MPGIALVRHVPAPLPARNYVRADDRPVEPEYVEEVWDAELVGDPISHAGPAVASYLSAGYAVRAPRVDTYA